MPLLCFVWRERDAAMMRQVDFSQCHPRKLRPSVTSDISRLLSKKVVKPGHCHLLPSLIAQRTSTHNTALKTLKSSGPSHTARHLSQKNQKSCLQHLEWPSTPSQPPAPALFAPPSPREQANSFNPLYAPNTTHSPRKRPSPPASALTPCPPPSKRKHPDPPSPPPPPHATATSRLPNPARSAT